MGRNKDLSDFDKSQIVMARQQGQNRIVGCSQSAVVRIYQQWSEEGQTTNQRQGVGRPMRDGRIYARRQRRLSHLVRANKRSANDDYMRNMSQRSRRLIRAPIDPCPLSKAPTIGTQAPELDVGAVEEGLLDR